MWASMRGAAAAATAVVGRASRSFHTVRVHGGEGAGPQSVRELLRGGEGIVGQQVTAKGWVRACRAQKTVSFVEVGDGSSLQGLQVVIPDGVAIDGAGDDGRRVPVGASVAVTGELVTSPGKKGAAAVVELQASKMAVVGDCDGATYPLQKKGHTTEFLRDIVHLRPRSNLIGAVTRTRHRLAAGLRAVLAGEGFFEVATPVITSNDCEGAGELFSLTAPKDTRGAATDKFFGGDAFLTVSGQLHAEAFATALSKVYTFGPTFRAEDSNTSRHLAEFWMLEPEVAFASADDVMGLAERCVQGALRHAVEEGGEDMRFFNLRVDKGAQARVDAALSAPFERLTYTEAVQQLEKLGAGGEEDGGGLTTEQEKLLCEHIGRPVFVSDYPTGCKPFYMRRNDDGETVACFDLLVPRLGELVGGSAREERFDVLRQVMMDSGLLTSEEAAADAPAAGMSPASTANNLQWYLDLRRYGSVPHAGWGLGFERLVQFMTGVENIRDAIPVPRAPRQCRL